MLDPMNGCDVAAYIWPSYHYESRLAHFWPENDGEWYTVRRGTPRFPGHDMPRIPLLGCQDEASPEVMAQHAALALDHGINTFIVDWYWYDGQACLERQLNDGLIPALKESPVKFYLMWANHDANQLWDMHTDDDSPLLWTGQVSREVLEPMFERIIDRYFSLDSYYLIGSAPVFSIFDYPNFVNGLGGLDEARRAMDWMRERCAARGFSGVHFQAIARAWAHADMPPERLGFDSATCYQFCMHAGGEGDYVPWAESAMKRWPEFESAYGLYFPHASVGWDDTHRHPGKKTAVINHNPASFEACLWRAKAWLDARPGQHRLVTLNSWNEWTEGSYLLPDLRWGYEMLRSVKRVFG